MGSVPPVGMASCRVVVWISPVLIVGTLTVKEQAMETSARTIRGMMILRFMGKSSRNLRQGGALPQYLMIGFY